MAMVRFRRLVAPPSTSIICTLPPPLIVMPGEPVGPVMVRLLSVIIGRVLPSAMVPVRPGANTMLSVPLPAAHPLVAVMLLAAVIASRRTQIPVAPVSLRLVTVMVLARPIPDIASNKSGSAIAANLLRRFKPAMDPLPAARNNASANRIR